jgi:hypothetical protein
VCLGTHDPPVRQGQARTKGARMSSHADHMQQTGPHTYTFTPAWKVALDSRDTVVSARKTRLTRLRRHK